MKRTTATIAPRLAAAALCLFAAGCATVNKISDHSYSARCADFMRQAYPGGGDIKVTAATSAIDAHAAALPEMTAQVTGVRSDVPATGFIARDVAVECRFDNGVLTNFRWTRGPFR